MVTCELDVPLEVKRIEERALESIRQTLSLEMHSSEKLQVIAYRLAVFAHDKEELWNRLSWMNR